MTDDRYDVVVAGHVCLDLIPRFHNTGAKTLGDIMVPGKLVNVGPAAVSSGGPVSNTGIALLKLGIKTGLMGKIGNDFIGSGVRDIFEKWHAAGALTVVEGEASSYTVVIAPPGIDRVFLHNPGTNDTFGADDVNYDIVAQARLFHFGYPPLMKRMYNDTGAELTEIFRRVKDRGVTTSLDMTLPDPDAESGKVDWDTVLTNTLPYVDIAPLSAEESLYMLNRKRFDQLRDAAGHGDPLPVYEPADFLWLGRELLERGAAVVLLKCGARGVVLFTADATRLAAMGPGAPADPDAWANQVVWCEAFEVKEIASAAGSGDSAIAGFLAAVLYGLGPVEAVKAACSTGCQNLRELDAVSGVHAWEETLAMIPGWPREEQQPGDGWRFDEALEVWRLDR